MSIIKMINMARQTHGDLDDLHTYICSASKTKDGTLIGTNNILSKMHVMEMQTVKKVYNKTDKRQCAHMVVSLTPDCKDRSDQLYLKTANQIAQLFPGFQCFYAVHIDSALRHMHFVWNSVSCLDGHKFEQSRSDLSRLKQRCNDIIVHHGFDPIIIGADYILDTQDHRDATNFDFLEEYEVVSNSDTENFYRDLNWHDLGDFRLSESKLLKMGRAKMRPMNYGSMPIATQRTVNEISQPNLTASLVEQPTLIAAPGCVTVLENPDTPLEETVALVQGIMNQGQDYAMTAASIGNAMHTQNLSSGIHETMIISATPAIIIDRRGGIDNSHGRIIDIPYTENK